MEFCSDIKQARVFDCRRNRVEYQIALIRLIQGIPLEVEPVDPKEIHETRDRCGRLVLSFPTHFHGERYLCRDCRNGTSA